MTKPDKETQRQVARTVGVTSAVRHIFLCCDQTEPKCTERESSLEVWRYLKTRLRELGLSESGGVLRTKANCLRICQGGPIAVIYPEGAWYGNCTRDNVERIIQEHLVAGRVVEDLLIERRPLEPPESEEGP